MAPQISAAAHPVRVVASARRRRTVSARLIAGVIEVRVPAWMGAAERAEWVERMRARIQRQLARTQTSDEALEARARELNRRYFGGRLTWSRIVFARQSRRWGSCATASGVIRISHRASDLPAFVLDYVIVHELAHLEVAAHSAEFWRLVLTYPLAERARGYLMGLDQASAWALKA